MKAVLCALLLGGFALSLYPKDVVFTGKRIPENKWIPVPASLRCAPPAAGFLILKVAASPSLIGSVIRWKGKNYPLFEHSIRAAGGDLWMALPTDGKPLPKKISFTSFWPSVGTVHVEFLGNFPADPKEEPLFLPADFDAALHPAGTWVLCKNERQQWRIVDLEQSTAASYTSRGPEDSNGIALLADFSDIRTRQGGFVGTFKGRGASITIQQTPGILHISSKETTEGFAGVWIQLYDASAETPALLNATGYSHLAVQWKPADGEADMALQLADEAWLRKEDSTPIGKAKISSQSVSESGWRTAVIPLAGLPLDQTLLANLVLSFTGFKDQETAIGKIFLAKTEEAARAVEYPSDSPAVPESLRSPELGALYMWDTLDVLKDSKRQIPALLKVIRDWNIGTLYLQLPYRLNQEPDAAWMASGRFNGLRRLVSKLHKEGLQVHALEGWKGFARRELHARAVAQAMRVVRFNARVGPAERFDAFHLDVEPYLLNEYVGTGRGTVLSDYAAMLEKVKASLKSRKLPLFIDIPFWFDTVPGGVGLLERLAAILDGVVIMDYRTQVWGADGILAQASTEIGIFNRAGITPRVGIETMDLPPEEYYSVLSSNPGGDFKTFLMEWKDAGGYLLSPVASPGSALKLKYATASERISFHGRTTADLVHTLDETRLFFGDRISGIALHHFGSLKSWEYPASK